MREGGGLRPSCEAPQVSASQRSQAVAQRLPWRMLWVGLIPARWWRASLKRNPYQLALREIELSYPARWGGPH